MSCDESFQVNTGGHGFPYLSAVAPSTLNATGTENEAFP